MKSGPAKGAKKPPPFGGRRGRTGVTRAGSRGRRAGAQRGDTGGIRRADARSEERKPAERQPEEKQRAELCPAGSQRYWMPIFAAVCCSSLRRCTGCGSGHRGGTGVHPVYLQGSFAVYQDPVRAGVPTVPRSRRLA